MITDIISDLERKKQELIQFLENNMPVISPKISIETTIPNDKKQSIFTKLFYKISKRKKSTSITHKEVLSQSECIELYNKIKTVIEAVDDNWKEFLVGNKNILKETIDSTAWNSEDKTNYSLKAMVTSAITYQMSDILTKIIKFGKETDEKGLNNYITELKKELLFSIDVAYNEQKLIYDEIIERLNKN